MQRIFILFLLSLAASAQTPADEVPIRDSVRVDEFYRLAAQIQDQVWANWSKTPAPLLLVTPNAEFLTHQSGPPPKDFKKIGNDVFARPRQFSTRMQATFPAFGPPSVIVIGEPENTASKTSTPWLIVLMHEHFHQLQYSQPGYFQALKDLGLSHGDASGMWVLNYPFPYDKPEIQERFAHLRDLLFNAVNETEQNKFEELTKQYIQERKKFFAQLSSDDRKYLSFQLWQEGVARYTQVEAAEAAAHYQPTEAYTALADYESFSSYAAHARKDTLNELRRIDLAASKREVVYSFGATEAMLLDRFNPGWKEKYFEHLFSMDSFFP